MSTEYMPILTLGSPVAEEIAISRDDRLEPTAGILEKTREAFAIPAQLLQPQKVTCLSCGGHFFRNFDGSIPCGH